MSVPEFPDAPAPLRFLDLATRPLEADPGLHEVAWADLARRIQATPETTEAVLERAAGRFEAADRCNWRKRILPLVGAAAFLSFAVITGMTIHRLIQFREFAALLSPLSLHNDRPGPDRFAKNWSPDERLLLFGNPDAISKVETWKPLWDSDRSNPAFLQACAHGYLEDQQEIPVDLLKQSEAIDPGNAFLPILVAGDLAKDAIERKEGSRSRRDGGGEAPEWVIKDQARFDQAFEALRKAAELPGFTDHSSSLHRQRFRHLPEGRDFLARISILAYTAQAPSPGIRLAPLSKLLAAKAATLSGSGDIAEFQECVRLWKWLVERCTESSWTLIDGLIARVMIQTPLKNFREAADRLGLDETSRDFRVLDERMELEKKQRTDRSREESPEERLIFLKGSCLASLSIPMIIKQVLSPPTISGQDLHPGRMVDHALLGQMHATVTALCFILLMLVALVFRTVVPRGPRAVAHRMADLVSPHDQIFLLAAGVLCPAGLYVALIQFPDLSAREWAMKSSGFLAPVGQLAAVTLLMVNFTIALGALVARKRVPMLAPAGRPWLRLLPWLGTFCAVLAMLACGINFGRGPVWCGYGIMLLIPAAIWPLVCLLAQFFRKSGEREVRHAVLHGFLAPVWGGAAILCVLAFAFHRCEEIKWTGRDRLMAPDPEARGMFFIEGEIAKQLHSELREWIKMLPPA